MQLIITRNKLAIGIGLVTRFKRSSCNRVRWLFIGWRGLTFIGWDWIPHGYYGIKYRHDQVTD